MSGIVFEQLCSKINDVGFWNNFTDLYVSRSSLRYYIEKFTSRVKFLAVKKNISYDSLDYFAKAVSLRKFRVACERYYNLKGYSEADVKDDGAHLLSVLESYMWVAAFLGVSQEILVNIRLEIDQKCVQRLFDEDLGNSKHT